MIDLVPGNKYKIINLLTDSILYLTIVSFDNKKGLICCDWIIDDMEYDRRTENMSLVIVINSNPNIFRVEEIKDFFTRDLFELK